MACSASWSCASPGPPTWRAARSPTSTITRSRRGSPRRQPTGRWRSSPPVAGHAASSRRTRTSTSSCCTTATRRARRRSAISCCIHCGTRSSRSVTRCARRAPPPGSRRRIWPPRPACSTRDTSPAIRGSRPSSCARCSAHSRPAVTRTISSPRSPRRSAPATIGSARRCTRRVPGKNREAPRR